MILPSVSDAEVLSLDSVWETGIVNLEIGVLGASAAGPELICNLYANRAGAVLCLRLDGRYQRAWFSPVRPATSETWYIVSNRKARGAGLELRSGVLPSVNILYIDGMFE